MNLRNLVEYDESLGELKKEVWVYESSESYFTYEVYVDKGNILV